MTSEGQETPRQKLTKKLLEYFAGEDKRLLKGKVSLLGTETKQYSSEGLNFKETAVKRGSLYFDPELTTAETDSKALPTLYNYLMTYSPVTQRGLLFNFQGIFSLHEHKIGLTLFLYEDRDWGSGEALTVIDHSLVDLSELEENILSFPQASKFVMGKLIEQKDYPKFRVLRRYFLE